MFDEVGSSKIPVILNIDVEPDEFSVDRADPKPWTGFEFCYEYFKELRSRFEEVTGHPVHFNWMIRMDPQIEIAYGSAAWAADRYADILAEYRSEGDNVGLHVHTYTWSTSLDSWLDDCDNPEWVAHCLGSSMDAYKQAFGETCKTLRYGSFWVSTEALNLAEQLGIKYDLTLEPGLLSRKLAEEIPRSGRNPSYCRVPRHPYVPSKTDFRKLSNSADERSIVLIPLTSAYKKLGWGPGAWKTRIGRILRNGVHGRLQSTPLSMVHVWEGDNAFSAMLDRAIATQKQPYLSFAIRANIHKKRFPRIDSSLKALLDHSESSRFIFCTPHEAMEQMSSQTVQSNLVRSGIKLVS